MTDWDLKKLRVLRALHECGTVTAAGARLNLTPSAVSQQLAALARQVGAPMVEPYGRRVRLTAAARLVLRHADRVFGQLEQAEAELAGYLHGEAGEVRVGAFATAITALVVPAVVRLRESAPRLAVRVVEAEAAEAVALLAAGAVDVSVSLNVRGSAGEDPRFVQVPVLDDPLDVALPLEHPWARREGLRLAELADEPWIFGGSGPWRDITLGACAEAGFVPERAHTAADWAAILTMVGAGLGVALVPRLLVGAGSIQGARGVAVRTLPADLPSRRVVAAVRAGTEQAPPLRRVLSEIVRSAAL
ncbi:LysR family transcriptional regulator [Kitasatospora sp. NBC_01287]|uniref:LysR family transcriptional regulator n=1 Tax=Kitasatospora sp. NBC_01287 TaxID=2903573 RepID=UPI00225118E0|nr:LysR family transcriptional regulator [Kitasatospora sp. NBC_01287]MCX4747886.1 LysR family transcriptional regulator [Kitasatospora sp. NBC_01287]